MSQGDLLKFLCVGKLAIAPDGSFKSDKHQILCSASSSNTNDSQTKAYKTHAKAIMAKGAAKLLPGKRIRLTSDDNDYDLHVLSDALNDDSRQIYMFFAVTIPDFNKYHPIANLLKQLKNDFYGTFHLNDNETNHQSSNELTTTGSSMNKMAQPFLNKILSQYSSSSLQDVQAKVDTVKEIMKTNVSKALENVEQLEDMEEKAETFEEQAKNFNKNATKVKSLMRSRYMKICAILILAVLVIVAIIALAIYSKAK